MRISDFYIGLEFTTGGSKRFRCTDIGTRVIVAIDLNDPEEIVVYDRTTKTETMCSVPLEDRPRYQRGPPYGIVEIVFDEYALPACEPLATSEKPSTDLERQTERARAFMRRDHELLRRRAK